MLFSKKKETFEEKAIKMLIKDEGLRLKPYLDSVGKLTIGIGRNLDDKGISKDEAYYFCRNDIKDAEADARALFPEYDTYSEEQRLALLNMSFNMGRKTLGGFRNTIRLIKNKLWHQAKANALLSKWANQVKGRAKRVTDLFLNRNTEYDFEDEKGNEL